LCTTPNLPFHSHVQCQDIFVQWESSVLGLKGSSLLPHPNSYFFSSLSVLSPLMHTTEVLSSGQKGCLMATGCIPYETKQLFNISGLSYI
jgi:hypothetical protein